jgi:uncharacterized protein
MRVVVDTNVFVSAALKASSWPGAVVVWLEKNGGLLKTAVTEQELFEVMVRPRFAGGIQPLHIATMRRIFARAEAVPITETVIACRDPKDDKFLELALNGHADVVVSGDADLLTLNPFRGVPILSPATFSRAMIIGRI